MLPAFPLLLSLDLVALPSYHLLAVVDLAVLLLLPPHWAALDPQAADCSVALHP